MCSWQVWSISVGETSVEGQDHDVYRNVAKSRGDVSRAGFFFRPVLFFIS